MLVLVMTKINISSYVKNKFPGLSLGGTEPFSPVNTELEVNSWVSRIKSKWNLETLKDEPIISAYRSFLWELDIDPTKTRPASEALIRMAFRKGIPSIHPVVDAMNIASALTGIPMSSFDKRIIKGDFTVRFAEAGEMYFPHTGTPKQLNGNEIVLENNENILCLYPYRDSKFGLIKKDTSQVIVVSYGVPGVQDVGEPIRLMLHLLDAKTKINVFS